MTTYNTSDIESIYINEDMIRKAVNTTYLVIEGLIHTAVHTVRSTYAGNNSNPGDIILEVDARWCEMLAGRKPKSDRNPKELKAIAAERGFKVDTRHGYTLVTVPESYETYTKDAVNDIRLEVKVLENIKFREALVYGFVKSRSRKTIASMVHRQEYILNSLAGMLTAPTLIKCLKSLIAAGLVEENTHRTKSGMRYKVYKTKPYAKAKSDTKSEPKACKDEHVAATPEVVDAPMPDYSTPDWI